MKLRERAKPRRRDIAAQGHFSPPSATIRTLTTRGETTAAQSSAPTESEGAEGRANPRDEETKTILRFDGDSIAYFWALENETAISHETLMMHWRAFADALTNSCRG